jgi:hypothetical protein
MWIAEREIVNPSNEENAAMGYIESDRFAEKSDAKAALIAMIEKELAGWRSHSTQGLGTDAVIARETEALERLQSDAVDVAEVDGVRWGIREF